MRLELYKSNWLKTIIETNLDDYQERKSYKSNVEEVLNYGTGYLMSDPTFQCTLKRIVDYSQSRFVSRIKIILVNFIYSTAGN